MTPNGHMPPVLDACCGPRMMWFDRADERAVFVDKRREIHMAADCSVKNGEGKLIGDWRDMIRHGFEECFRVLKPNGTLIFKWAETQFPVSEILALTPVRPLFGQRCGKTAKTHWIVFMKSRA